MGLEGIAQLTNLLYPLLSPYSATQVEPTDDRLGQIFRTFHRLHLPRAKLASTVSAKTTRLEAQETFSFKILSRYILPALGDGFKIRSTSKLWTDGPILNFLPEGKLALTTVSSPWPRLLVRLTFIGALPVGLSILFGQKDVFVRKWMKWARKALRL